MTHRMKIELWAMKTQPPQKKGGGAHCIDDPQNEEQEGMPPPPKKGGARIHHGNKHKAVVRKQKAISQLYIRTRDSLVKVARSALQ